MCPRPRVIVSPPLEAGVGLYAAAMVVSGAKEPPGNIPSAGAITNAVVNAPAASSRRAGIHRDVVLVFMMYFAFLF